MTTEPAPLKRTPLHAKHVGLGARMVPFAGWEMPLQYSGIIEEHLHTREKASLFDICHMGELFLKGPVAAADVGRLGTFRVRGMEPGMCRYGFLTRVNGTIVDDLIVFRMGKDEFMLVVNAATRDKDVQWIQRHISKDTEFSDHSDEMAKIDLQGPASGDVMGRVAGSDVVDGLGRFRFRHVEIEGVHVLLSRTGYTGELGYELFFPASDAEKIWDVLAAFDEVEPAGLGARDTLRLEMGYPLFGQDIDDSRTPIHCNMGRLVDFRKGFFGRRVLWDLNVMGADQILIGFVCEGRRAARPNFAVIVDGASVGEVTSGAFSPSLKRAIGLCYVDRNEAMPGNTVLLRNGNVEIPAVLESLPVLKKEKPAPGRTGGAKP